MRSILVILVFASLNLYAQQWVQCGDALSQAKGTLVDTSATKPQMKLTSAATVKPGAMGLLSLLTEDGNFTMTFSIGVVKVVSVDANQITFEVLEKLGVMTINGVERSNFRAGELVQFSEYVYDQKQEIATYWPSGQPKEKGTQVCGKKIGTWEEYHENGQVKVKFKANEDGEIHGDYVEYHANGAKAVEGAYSFGEKSGWWTEYFDNGVIKSQGMYYSNEKSGKWIEHDASGKKMKVKY